MDLNVSISLLATTEVPNLTFDLNSNVSFTAYQYEKFGYYTNSMVVVNFIHALYVLDFFYNEDWYLRTIVRTELNLLHQEFDSLLLLSGYRS
jgi:Ergosterol biosynthesis ERG4/ERG24 family